MPVPFFFFFYFHLPSLYVFLVGVSQMDHSIDMIRLQLLYNYNNFLKQLLNLFSYV
jgi:hypothetical protein